MQTLKSVHWQDGDAFLGCLLDYPDYWTQGDSLDDLKDHLGRSVSGSDQRRTARHSQGR